MGHWSEGVGGTRSITPSMYSYCGAGLKVGSGTASTNGVEVVVVVVVVVVAVVVVAVVVAAVGFCCWATIAISIAIASARASFRSGAVAPPRLHVLVSVVSAALGAVSWFSVDI